MLGNYGDGSRRMTDSMNSKEMLMAMSEGNNGAISILMDLLKKPDGFLSWIELDAHNIYGDKIWMLYKDCCQQDIHRFYLTLNLFMKEAFTPTQIQNNLKREIANPFIDDDIKLEENVYDMKKDKILDILAFEDYAKLQSESYKKRENLEAEKKD